MKRILIVLMISSLLILGGCSSKSAKLKEDTYLRLSGISEDITDMISDCDSALRSEDYDSMEEELGIIQYQLEKIQSTVDALADRYADRPYD